MLLTRLRTPLKPPPFSPVRGPPANGLPSYRSLTTASGFRRRPPSCPRSPSIRLERGAAARPDARVPSPAAARAGNQPFRGVTGPDTTPEYRRDWQKSPTSQGSHAIRQPENGCGNTIGRTTLIWGASIAVPGGTGAWNCPPKNRPGWHKSPTSHGSHATHLTETGGGNAICRALHFFVYRRSSYESFFPRSAVVDRRAFASGQCVCRQLRRCLRRVRTVRRTMWLRSASRTNRVLVRIRRGRCRQAVQWPRGVQHQGGVGDNEAPEQAEVSTRLLPLCGRGSLR